MVRKEEASHSLRSFCVARHLICVLLLALVWDLFRRF
jgi:hypothetical protein